jgi:hypothetical protein
MRVLEVLPKQKLFEMPYLITGQITWPMQNDAANLQVLTRIQQSNPVVLRDDRRGILYAIHGSSAGEYAFLSKLTNKIEYYMEYRTASDPDLKSCATQISVWRRAVAPRGLTVEVFFDHMLDTFDTMISDDSQTPSGQSFWLAMLAEALDRGFHIGMLDGTAKHIYNPATDFNAWITSMDGWGPDSDHWHRRFFITKVDLQPAS